MTMRMKKTDNS